MTLTVVQTLAMCARKCAHSRDGRTDAGAVREAANRLRALGYSDDAARADAMAMRRVGEVIRGFGDAFNDMQDQRLRADTWFLLRSW